MKLSRNWLGGFGLATLSSVLGLVACSGGGDDDGTQPLPPAGGAQSFAGAAQVGGSPAGAPAVGGGGTGGSGVPVAGAETGGSATAGAGGGAAGESGFACAAKAMDCAIISSFGETNKAGFGAGDFQGGVSVFGEGLTRESELDSIHVKGTVAGYGRGFNIWFNYCSDFKDVTGVTFTLSGKSGGGGAAPPAGGSDAGGAAGSGGAGSGGDATAGAATGGTGGASAPPAPLKINFEVQTNTNYPWQPRPEDKKGACTSPTPENPWNDCVPSAKNGILVPETPTEVTVTFATDLTGGTPEPWSADKIKEIIGFQWQFPWSGSATAYDVDVTVDNVKFLSSTVTAECAAASAPAGGAGGGSAGGASGGGASGDGAGGASAGTGGASAGTDGT